MSDNIQLVKDYFAAFSDGDAEATVARFMAEDVVLENKLPTQIPFSGVYHGHAGVLEYLDLINQYITITRFDFHEYASVGDRVFVSGYEESDLKAGGRSYTMEWVHEMRFADGKMKLMREYNICADMLRAFTE